MIETNNFVNPAELLAGRRHNGGWTVIKRIMRPALATGGHFSVSYIVESDQGQRGFLKALDFSDAFQQPDVTQVLQAMTWAFNHERELLEHCAQMRRVVTALAHGEIRDGSWPYPVSYLIFEQADEDARVIIDTATRFDMAWCLRALHHACVGLGQLHTGNIAHQDLKPSNLLYFNTVGSKLGDLGRSSHRTVRGPFDDIDIPGDKTYAAPEFLYGVTLNDWEQKLAADMYQLGSLVLLFFTRVGMTSALLTRLDRRVSPQVWRGTYAEVLPFIQKAFSDVLAYTITQIPTSVRKPIFRIIAELCEPDPNRRGHPKNRLGHQNRYGLERYVSQLDLLARGAEYGMRSGRR